MQNLVGKKVKAVIDDDGNIKTIYGILIAFSDHDVTIQGERDGGTIVIGRRVITILKEA